MLEKNEPVQKIRKSRWRKGERLELLFCGMSRAVKAAASCHAGHDPAIALTDAGHRHSTQADLLLMERLSDYFVLKPPTSALLPPSQKDFTSSNPASLNHFI